MPSKPNIPRICEQCNEPFMAWPYKVNRGGGRFCSHACYAQFRSENKLSPEESFWRYVHKTETCWLWTGARDKNGYGISHVYERPIRAHRLSYELHYGALPEGMMACHTCDNPPCVNPAHLFPGDAKKNVDDKVEKERQARGEHHPKARLAEVDVIAIRTIYTGKRGEITQLAHQYGVSVGAIASVVHNRNWKHV